MSCCKCFPSGPRRKRATQGTSPNPPSSHSTTTTRVHGVQTPNLNEGQATQGTPRSRATTGVVGSRSSSGSSTALSRNSVDRHLRPSSEIARSLTSGRAAASEIERSSDVTARPVIFKRTASAEQRLNGPERYGLHFLNEEQFHADVEKNNVKFSVDIVAVHGFNGHPYRSWTSSKEKGQKLWLRDFLPEELPGSRIFSFGYAAEQGPTLAKGTIETFARSLLTKLQVHRAEPDTVNRSIIFLCHSMGGLVVKQSFVTAKIDEVDFGDIRKSVIGIFFFGTPHDGADATKYLKSLFNVANFAMGPVAWSQGHMRTDLIQPTSRNSHELSKLARDFRNQFKGVRIVSCLEMNKTRIGLGSTFIVDEMTGVMNVDGEKIIHMDGCDHEQISRFISPRDPNYQDVLFNLKEVIKDSMKFSKEQEELLATLDFDLLGIREQEVVDAYPGTGEWLFHNPSYLQWMQREHLERHHGIFWLKGKPGSGKSTLMKHAMLQTRRLQPRPVVLSFFFHGRGVNLEKSSDGLFRTLLRQILQASTQWPSEILREFRLRQRSRTWYSGRLSHFLRSALLDPTLQPISRQIFIFIDALDECNSRGSLNEIVHFLEDLTQAILTPGHRLSLNICVSKRDFPNLSKKSLEIEVERHNGKDISYYIQKNLKCSPKWQRISQDILLDRAEGVFMWVHLVVKELNTTTYDPHTQEEVLSILNAYPRKLGKLYERAIRKLKAQYFEESQRLFQWLLLDDYAFTPAELAYAMAFDKPFASLKECHDSDYFFGEDDLKRRVTFLSCGLIEFSHSSRRRLFPFFARVLNPQSLWTHGRVQLIHESVRSWLFETQAKNLLSLAPASRKVSFESWERESCQVRKQACSNYLATSELVTAMEVLNLTREPRQPQWSESLDELFTRYHLFHYSTASLYGIGFSPFRIYPVILDLNLKEQITVKIPPGCAIRIDCEY